MESVWTFKIGSIVFDGTTTTMTLLTMVIVFGLIFWASRNMQIRPTGKQNVLEWVVDFVRGINKDNLGVVEAPRFTLMSFTLFAFLLVANTLGLITEWHSTSNISFWKSPTANPAIDLILSLLVMVLANLLGVQKFGFIKYLKVAFLKPPAVMLPMNILEEFTNTLSLGLRLYGNIFAGEVMLSLICSMINNSVFLYPIAIILAIAWIGFSFFISALQAYVFVLLTNLYISHKILEEE